MTLTTTSPEKEMSEIELKAQTMAQINWDDAENPLVKLFVGYDVEGYVEEYELEGEEGYYTPNEQEKTLLVDAIYGVVSDIHEKLRALLPSDFDARIRSAIERKAEPVAIHCVDGQVLVAASEMTDEQKEQPYWLWSDKDAGLPTYGRWQKYSSDAPYIRADLVLAALSTPPAEPVRDEDKRIAVLEKAMEALRKTAVLLLQNAEGCAVNHYAGDFELHGLPGWLCDARKEIDAATAVLSEAPEPFTVGEPVAYLTRRGGEDRVVLAKFMTEAEKTDGSNGWSATPLYASPSPVGDSRDGLIERLTKALEPFARAGDNGRGSALPDDAPLAIVNANMPDLPTWIGKVSGVITQGDIREARAVLAAKEQQP